MLWLFKVISIKKKKQRRRIRKNRCTSRELREIFLFQKFVYFAVLLGHCAISSHAVSIIEMNHKFDDSAVYICC